MNISKSTVQFTVGCPEGKEITVLISQRRKVTYSSVPSTRMAAVAEGFLCQHWFPFSGKVAAGPQSH